MKQEAIKSALSTAKDLSQIPNAPFLYKPPLDYIKGHEALKNPAIKTVEDTFAFYANIASGHPKRKIIITTHLDHPFVVLDGKGHGIPFGTIPAQILSQALVKIYTREGNLIGRGEVYNPRRKENRTIVDISGPDHPTNSHAIWDLEPPYKSTGEELEMVAADDVITTAVALEAIREIASKPYLDINLTVAFTKVEEVRQASATGIAMRKRFSFGNISPEDIIIPLEADHIETGQRHLQEARRLGLNLPSPDGGLIIKSSNHQVVLGQEFPNHRNEAEDILLNIAHRHGVPVQACVAAGADDGTAFTIFPTTPHIATLSLPNPTKHNYGGSPTPTYERVKMADVHTLLKILVALGTENVDLQPNHLSLSNRLKTSRLKADRQTISNLRREHLQVLVSSLPHLFFGKYFAESPIETGINILAAILSRALTIVVR